MLYTFSQNEIFNIGNPIDENIVEYTLMLMDLIPTFRTAEL